MSASTIARWNAIPLNRSDAANDTRTSLKRERPEDNTDGDDSDDDISLVSRSPSPTLPPADDMDIDKYDDYVRGPARDVITVETKIQSNNKGFLMLANMGWVEGQPLGLSGDGRVDPVPFYVKNDLTGLGKTTQDVRMIESTVAQRRELDSERQTKETEEQRIARENEVAKRAVLQSQISSTLRAFYCELCDKQFKNVAQYDEHTNSYAHHHKARFRDMQAAQRASRNSQKEVDRRKEKERKREEKELRKIAKAAGVKMAKPPVSLLAAELGTGSGGEGESKTSGVKKSGWASVSSPAAPAVPRIVPSSSSRTGWTAAGVGSSAQLPADEAATASRPDLPSPESATSLSQTPSGHLPAGPPPAFRTGGWTSLDTGSSVQGPPQLPVACPPPAVSSFPPPTPTEAIAQPPLPSAPVSASIGWKSIPIAVSSPQFSHSNPPDQAGTPAFASAPGPIINPETPSAAQPQAQSRPKQPKVPARQEASRSGWQQFRTGAPGRRK